VEHSFCQCGNWPSAFWYRESARTFYSKKNLKPELIIFYCCRHIWPPILKVDCIRCWTHSIVQSGSSHRDKLIQSELPPNIGVVHTRVTGNFIARAGCQVQWKQRCSHNFFCSFERAILIGPSAIIFGTLVSPQ